MKKIVTLIALAFSVSAFAQTPAPVDTAKVDTFKHWKSTFMFGINVGASNFSNNWQGGGVSNYALGSLLNAGAKYKSRDSLFRWENTLNLQYGVQRNKGQGMRKSADLIFFDSKLSGQFSKSWSGFFGLTFLSQFTRGYEYTTDVGGAELRNRISSFMSPGYLTEALGFEYKPAPYFSARIGLGATRQTFVLDQSLYSNVDTVRYGVPVGKKLRNELGFQLLLDFNKDIFKNINLKARYMGFANYSTLSLNKIDHRFDVILTAKVNRFINVNFATIFLYDFDQVDTWQHSEVFSLGIQYKVGK